MILNHLDKLPFQANLKLYTKSVKQGFPSIGKPEATVPFLVALSSQSSPHCSPLLGAAA